MAGLIFDLDDTLFDHRGAAEDGVRRWLTDMQLEPTEELLSLWFAAEERYYASWQRGEITHAEQRRRRLREILPHVGKTVDSDPELDLLFDGYLSEYQAAWRCFDDVQPTLDALASFGITIAILTNGAEHLQSEKLARTGLDERIALMLTSEQLGVAKPHPHAYQLACSHLGLDVAEVLHIGDRYDLDVLAPRGAGLAALHLDRHKRGPLDEPDRLTSLIGLADFLEAATISAPT